MSEKSTVEMFKEWFSINGGTTFGYTRLAYYIGFVIVESFVKELGIEKTMTLWGRPDFKKLMAHRMQSF